MTLGQIQQRLSTSSAGGGLAQGEAQVWVVDGDPCASAVMHASRHLTPDEVKRAFEFVFPQGRHMFTTVRAALRMILGWYAGCPPGEIRFAANEYGKPYVTGPPKACAVAFNVSHTGSYAAILIASTGPVGVDLERPRPGVSEIEIAARYFSPREHRWLMAQPVEKRTEQFYRLWVVKEAVIKAQGRGLSVPLAETEIEFVDGQARPVSGAWWIQELDLIEGCFAAVALKAPCRLSILR
jgi:4'-phosphopantetheinyl transferase